MILRRQQKYLLTLSTGSKIIIGAFPTSRISKTAVPVPIITGVAVSDQAKLHDANLKGPSAEQFR